MGCHSRTTVIRAVSSIPNDIRAGGAMRPTLPRAAALVVAVAAGLAPLYLRAASPQAGQPAQTPAMARLTGRVVSGDPARGVPRALVTASANGKLVASAMTDASGTFAIDAPASTTSISVSK